jgi:hypothetical protein
MCWPRSASSIVRGQQIALKAIALKGSISFQSDLPASYFSIVLLFNLFAGLAPLAYHQNLDVDVESRRAYVGLRSGPTLELQ